MKTSCNNIMIYNKNILVILEFGIPHYRKFIFNWFEKKFNAFKIIHSNERFKREMDYNACKCLNTIYINDIRICLFNIFKIRKYDIIISTFNYRRPHTWLPWFLFKRKKWIFWGKGVGRSSNKLLLLLKKHMINNSSGYVVYTPSGKKELVSIGVNPSKISIAYNTLKISNSEVTNGSEYLLYVGRIQKRKGLHKVLEAIKGTPRKLVIVGNDGDYGEKFKVLINKMGLQNQVIFKGAIYDEEMLKKIFSKSVAYISPYHVGLGVVHAFAYGVPVITCKKNNYSPEFSYCSKKNSYLYKDDSELPKKIEEAFNDKERNFQKRIKAYEFYQSNLNYRNVLNAFEYHFEKLNNWNS